MNLRQLALFLGLNVIVSVAVTLIVLNVWDAGRAAPRAVPTPIATVQSVPAGVSSSVVPTAVPLTTSVPTNSPTAAARPSQYTVKEGDTLSSIARDFELSVDQLLAANHLANGDLLSIGQRLTIPGADGSRPVPTPTPIRPRPAVTATESIALGDAFVTIREINNGGTFSLEQVVLTNIGAKVNLIGWTLADGEGHKFTFPDLFWGQADARWGATGTVAYLRDPAGRLIATYRVP